MSGLDRYLSTTELLDCSGRVEHALTLLLDGRVRIRRGASTMVLDPATGHVEPPSAAVPDHVFHAACELAGRRIPAAGRAASGGHGRQGGHGHSR